MTLADADAVFVRDAHGWLSPDAGDVVASRGSFPQWAHQEWGATACMGLVRFNSGPATVAFAKSLLHLTTTLGDDQKAVNAALKKATVTWKADSRLTTKQPLSYVGSATPSSGDATVDDKRLKVTLLPHRLFQRRCVDEPTTDDIVVKHCYADKVAGEKKTALAQSGAWFLKDDWRAINHTHFASTSEWLAAVVAPPR